MDSHLRLLARAWPAKNQPISGGRFDHQLPALQIAHNPAQERLGD
jgi:hypothetical protein